MLSLASSRPSRVHLPTHLPSARLCCPRFPWFLTTAVLCGLCLLTGSRKPRQVSPLTLHCLPGIPPPTTSCARTSLCQSPQRVRPVQASPSMSRLAATRRRIGFVILRAARSLPAAPPPASRRRSCLQLHAM